MQLTLALLNRFVEEIISYHDCKTFSDKQLIELISAVDSEEHFWHVENNTVWKISSWKECLVNREKRRAINEKERQVFTSRKEALTALVEAVMSLFSVEEKIAHTLALKILHSRDKTKSTLLGVDISQLKEPTQPYIILDKKLGEYRL